MRDPEAVIRLLAHKNTKSSIFHVIRAKSSAAYSKPLPRDCRGCVGMGLGRGWAPLVQRVCPCLFSFSFSLF
jgi:hypothetical protein